MGVKSVGEKKLWKIEVDGMLAFVPPFSGFFFAMEGPRHQNGVGQEYRVQQRGRGNEATVVFDIKKLASGHFLMNQLYDKPNLTSVGKPPVDTILFSWRCFFVFSFVVGNV